METELFSIHSEKEGFSKTVHLPVEGGRITADWIMPPHHLGIVLFAHGSGSSRHRSRNKEVAQYLVNRGLGIFLLGLLTPGEEEIDRATRQLRFAIPLLANRLSQAALWMRRQEAGQGTPLGYFGASTGAAAALVSAAALPGEIAAVVSRGGRPDLAGGLLSRVTSPTLLLVGGRDVAVEDLNRKALEKLGCVKELVIIPGATHLFEEPGTLDQVAVLAADWFTRHFNHGSHGSEGEDAATITASRNGRGG